MSVRGRVAGALAVGAVGLAGAGVNRQRRQLVARAPGDRPAFGSLRSAPVTVIADDGTPLYVEVDEPEHPLLTRGPKPKPLTIIFAHGYAVSMDCWHFQREHYRQRGVRTVFYDQRSHGRSGRSPARNATIDQLGRDLRSVMDVVATDGPVVIAGHSMGGMTVITFAEQFPELLGKRVVGAALISTTAGGLEPSRVLFPMVPEWGGVSAVDRTVHALGRGHKVVDGIRRVGKDVAMVTIASFAFGDGVPGSYVTFLDEMLAATPFDVLADFFPSFAALDRFGSVGVLGKVPTAIICGTGDKITSIGHSRKLRSRIPGSTLLECHGAGHMVIMERYPEVNGELDQLLVAAGAEDN